jgi:hypothetical protein
MFIRFLGFHVRNISSGESGILVEYNPPISILLLDTPENSNHENTEGGSAESGTVDNSGRFVAFREENADVEVVKVADSKEEARTNRIFVYTHAAFLEVDEVW